jgi:hypothetical protein
LWSPGFPKSCFLGKWGKGLKHLSYCISKPHFLPASERANFTKYFTLSSSVLPWAKFVNKLRTESNFQLATKMGRKNLRTKPSSSQGNVGAMTSNPDADEQERIQRRRIQNRISQQCVRERRLAHAKQLESLKTMIKTSLNPSTATPEPSQNVLLSTQLELTNENKELTDALLRMRKKLLSLSSAAAAAAG